MKKRLLKKLLSNNYAKTGKNYDRRLVTRVKILANHYFAHWDNRGEAFVVECIPIKRKRIPIIGWGNSPNLTYRVSRHFFERSIKK